MDCGRDPRRRGVRARARRAGGRMLLFERYERVETIDYKSARDVVTEVDHLSEALLIDAIRARYPGDGILAEESGAHHGSGDGRRGADHADGRSAVGAGPRPRPHLDPRPARRHRELRQRHPVLLRVDRAGRGRPARGRRHPRPDARRDVLGDRGRPGDARRPRDPRLAQAAADRLRDLAGARRAGGRDAGPGGAQGHPGVAQHGVGGARARVRRERAVRRVPPDGRHVRVGRRGRRADRGARRGRSCPDASGGPWFDVDKATRAFGIVAAPAGAPRGAPAAVARRRRPRSA